MKIPLTPTNINPRNWFYENDGSINLVHQVFNGNQAYQQTDQILIPFRKLEPAFKRYLARRRINPTKRRAGK